MNYVMSDVHGCYDKYIRMLQKIDLKQDDQLYVLGDVVDRGPDGIKLLLDIGTRDNVILLRGNHDDIAYYILGCYLNRANKKDSFQKEIRDWLSDGGDTTARQFLLCDEKDKAAALKVIEDALYYVEIKVGNNTFLLSHTVPEKELMEPIEACPLREFLWGEPDYDEMYFEDKMLITGHTPTGLIDPEYKGRIWTGNNHIAVDCGAVYGNSLGCLCLDTMDEFYI